MTSEERVTALHERMDALRNRRERRKTAAIGAAGAVLSICLFLIIFVGGGTHAGGSAGIYSGATILFEGAGGYVLAAVLAFMAGVVVTVMILKKKQNQPGRREAVPEQTAAENRGNEKPGLPHKGQEEETGASEAERQQAAGT